MNAPTTTSPSMTALAAATGLGTAAWYAMPDVIRSRGTRAALKTLILAGVTTVVAAQPRQPATNGPDAVDELFHAVNEHPGRAALVGTGLLAGTTALTVWGEKALFAFGERRRARGVRFAHTVPALILAALATAAVAIDPPGKSVA